MGEAATAAAGKSGGGGGGGGDEESPTLQSKLVKALSRSIASPSSSRHSHASLTNNSNGHSGGTLGGGGSSSSGHGPGSGHGALGLGSGHGSGHNLSWHSSGGGGGGGAGSGHGTAGRRLSILSNASGSRHGPGSEAAPPPIPENGQLMGWAAPALESKGSGSSSTSSRSSAPPGLLDGFGKQVSLALHGTFGGEGGSGAGAGGTAISTTVGTSGSIEAAGGAGETLRGDADSSRHSETGSMSGVGRMAEGLMRHLDRAVSNMSADNGSAHGSGWGGSVSAAGGSAPGSTHGSVGSVGAWGGGGNTGGGGGGSRRPSATTSSMGVSGSGGGGSRRLSKSLLPWSQQDVDERPGEDGGVGDSGSSHLETSANATSDDVMGGLRRSVERVGRAFTGVGSAAPGANNDDPDEASKGRSSRAFTGVGAAAAAAYSTPRATPKVGMFGTPLHQGTAFRASGSAVPIGTPLRGGGGSVTDVSGHSHKRRLSTASDAATADAAVAGYEAAMAEWPAGKVKGNPAWEEWSPEKKLVCHLVTAGCLAAIVLTW